MKLIILLLFIPLCLNAQYEPNYPRLDVRNIKPDQQNHIYAGALISSTTFYVGHYMIKREMNPIAPSLISICVAATKEFYDSFNGGHFNHADFIYTSISGIITNIALHAIFKKKRREKKRKRVLVDL